MQRFVIAFMILVALVGAIYLAPRPEAHTLKVGICADSYWGVPDGDATAIWQEGIHKFQTEHPEVQVKLVTGIQKEDYPEWLSQQLMAGTEPDVFLIPSQDFASYAAMGAIRPLDSLMENDAAFDMDSYYPAPIQTCYLNDHYYALPLESVPTLMFVNKTLLAAKHIPLPAADWTWQDFYNICQVVTQDTDGNGRPDSFGCYGYTWQQAALDNGIVLFPDNGRSANLEGADMEKVIAFMASLQELNQGYSPVARDFDLGHIAFRPFTFAEYRTYQPYPWRVKKYSSFDWDIVPFPAGPNGTNLSQTETMLMGISSRSKAPQLAWELLKTLSADKSVQQKILTRSQGLPVRRDILTEPGAQELFLDTMGDSSQNLTLSAIHNIMLTAVPMPTFRKNVQVMEKADSFISRLIDEGLPPGNSLNQLQREINAELLE